MGMETLGYWLKSNSELWLALIMPVSVVQVHP